MEVFLLILILIVMLAALGWLPAVIRALAILATIIFGTIAVIIWIVNRQPEPMGPPQPTAFDMYLQQLNDKIYSEDKDTKPHDHSRRR